jgi:UDP-N-acetylglucosamine 4,6-dehydratase
MHIFKTLLVTGGSGSFGNAVLRHYLSNPTIEEIRIFSRDEKKQDDMRRFYQNDKIRFVIGDTRDIQSVEQATEGVDLVFHAAALKQVPTCEFFPMEAVATNIIGTKNVIDLAIKARAKKVVVLSTDKAVYPINAMGMTKALAEKLMVAKSRNLSTAETVVCATRYGNVMASRGSVIPLFVDQIKAGGPITITDPEMTRFMMTLEDAVDLVSFAFENARQGDIFVQKAPATTIKTLAMALMELYSKKCDINIIGTRHGEKEFESLVNREEMAKAEDLVNYFRISADTRDLNYEKFFSEGQATIKSFAEYTSHNTTRLDLEETKTLLLKLGFIRKDVLNEEQSPSYAP